MSIGSTHSLEDLIRECGMGSLVDWYVPREQAVAFLLEVLEQAGKESVRRYGSDAFHFSEDELRSEHLKNPHRVMALFQTMALTQRPHMLVMAWQVIEGADVRSLNVDFHRNRHCRIQIVLETSRPPTTEASNYYESRDVRDLRMIRHFATMEVNGRPYLTGFYPLRIERE